MENPIQLTPTQRRRCNRLIRKLCANYDDGNCLALDEGDGCVCVQIISLSLICKYFRNAVLPADKELCADIYKIHTGPCEICGKNVAPNAAKKYAADRKQKASENAAEWTVRYLKTPANIGFICAETRSVE